MAEARKTRNRTFQLVCGWILAALGLMQVGLKLMDWSGSPGDWFSLIMALVQFGAGVVIVIHAARLPKTPEDHDASPAVDRSMGDTQ
ncbi:hypothetical protein [Plantibacter cousiniae (nom. nud.)]|uniref:hypothetical protein n=1 Tax=Plantibacter cousiniae (nom. nud.) TaxID=199709 RepID=UPI001D7994B0|nr:hypothetical protein [Plantibacter cousiniae]CAH0175814.1 hypothetical protein SRABI02_01363 [Plantibacter cousiniae]